MLTAINHDTINLSLTTGAHMGRRHAERARARLSPIQSKPADTTVDQARKTNLLGMRTSADLERRQSPASRETLSITHRRCERLASYIFLRVYIFKREAVRPKKRPPLMGYINMLSDAVQNPRKPTRNQKQPFVVYSSSFIQQKPKSDDIPSRMHSELWCRPMVESMSTRWDTGVGRPCLYSERRASQSIHLKKGAVK